MTLPALISSVTIGTALLAVWCLVRWPRLAPQTFRGAMLHGLVAFGVLQVSAMGLGVAAGVTRALAAMALIALVVPALTYAFLAALWVMRLFAGTLKGV